MEKNITDNAVAAFLSNIKNLSSEMIKKLLPAETFSTPQIATYSLNQFHMVAPETRLS